MPDPLTPQEAERLREVNERMAAWNQTFTVNPGTIPVPELPPPTAAGVNAQFDLAALQQAQQILRTPARPRRDRRPNEPTPLTPDQIQLTQAYAEMTAIRVLYNAPGIEERRCVMYVEGAPGEGRNMAAMADVVARHLRDRLNLPTPPPPPPPDIPLTLQERMFNLLGLMAERAEFGVNIQDEWDALRGEYERFTVGRGL